MERGIIRSLQPRDKAAFGELEMTTRAIDQNYIDNFFRLDKNLIIYQFGVIVSDKICMILNNQNSKKNKDEFETKQHYDNDNSSEHSQKSEIAFKEKKVLEAYFLKHK